MAQVQYKLVWPPVTKPMIALAVVLVVLWLGGLEGAPLHELVRDNLTLTLDNVAQGAAVWSIFTYGFVEREFFGVLFPLLALWLIGGELATAWRPAKFWGMQAVAITLGGAASLALLWLFDSPLEVRGYQAAVMAVIAAYCWRVWRSPRQFFMWQMTGRTLLLLFVGFGVVIALFSRHWPALVLDAAGLLTGFAFSARSLHPRDLRTRIRLWRARRKLTLVKAPEDDQPPRKTADGQYIN